MELIESQKMPERDRSFETYLETLDAEKTIVIIGGGVAGTYMAVNVMADNRLVAPAARIHIVIVEKERFLGGLGIKAIPTFGRSKQLRETWRQFVLAMQHGLVESKEWKSGKVWNPEEKRFELREPRFRVDEFPSVVMADAFCLRVFLNTEVDDALYERIRQKGVMHTIGTGAQIPSVPEKKDPETGEWVPVEGLDLKGIGFANENYFQNKGLAYLYHAKGRTDLQHDVDAVQIGKKNAGNGGGNSGLGDLAKAMMQYEIPRQRLADGRYPTFTVFYHRHPGLLPSLSPNYHPYISAFLDVRQAGSEAPADFDLASFVERLVAVKRQRNALKRESGPVQVMQPGAATPAIKARDINALALVENYIEKEPKRVISKMLLDALAKRTGQQLDLDRIKNAIRRGAAEGTKWEQNMLLALNDIMQRVELPYVVFASGDTEPYSLRPNVHVLVDVYVREIDEVGTLADEQGVCQEELENRKRDFLARFNPADEDLRVLNRVLLEREYPDAMQSLFIFDLRGFTTMEGFLDRDGDGRVDQVKLLEHVQGEALYEEREVPDPDNPGATKRVKGRRVLLGKTATLEQHSLLKGRHFITGEHIVSRRSKANRATVESFDNIYLGIGNKVSVFKGLASRRGAYAVDPETGLIEGEANAYAVGQAWTRNGAFSPTFKSVDAVYPHIRRRLFPLLNRVEAEAPLTQEAGRPARMDNTNVKRLTPFWIRGRLVLSDMSDGPIVTEDGEILTTLAEVRQYEAVKSRGV